MMVPSNAHGRPLVIGHRGFRARFPENTVAAVRAALAAGADGVEVDVRPTADGLWVAHHDLRRRGLHSRRWRWNELAREGVDDLASILAELDAAHWLFLEIKPLPHRWLDPLLGDLAAAVAAHGPRTRILSSSVRILLAASQAFQAARFSLVLKRSAWAPLPGAWSLSPHHTLVEALAISGRELHPWTVNHPSRLRHLANLGVASVTTDDPELALRTLNESH